MNRGLTLFVGILATFTLAWAGLVLIPYLQFGRVTDYVSEETGQTLPPPMSGLAQRGHEVYAAEGCVYCHSQQVRGESQGSDLARGWGVRRTVARDYIGERPHFLGTMRTGPDLSNIGRRQSSVEWHHKHLYRPQSVSPGSVMPPFRFLYSLRKIVGEPSADALKLDGLDAPPPGWEVVPTPDAKALVAYLLSLDRSYPLPEAPTE
ncbi:MAG: cbb3-type cytochrome c oxidase subunit II [Verrucomicrobiae bacterium]|nr:cbb3-type cytochrome c oxidase subunit II [Verrucomicrobiae bacterium]